MYQLRNTPLQKAKKDGCTVSKPKRLLTVINSRFH
jgi:hypothetical protein